MSTTDAEGSTSPISTVAGTGVAGFKGEGEPAVSAQLNRPYGVAVDSAGVVYFSDYNNHRVRKITTDGKISTVAGTGVAGYRGDDGPAVAALLNCPRQMAVDGADALYVTDSSNHRIRKIAADGKITTVAGTGIAGFLGDGGPATAARLNLPLGIAVDSSGIVYFSDYNNHRVRKITTDGKISTVAGTGAPAYRGGQRSSRVGPVELPSPGGCGQRGRCLHR
ncbi:NHL domain-containing protein [Streptomyces pratensis]